MQLETFLIIVITIYGVIIGSFLNVCIYRIPKNESIIVNRSHCMNCGKQIKWYDLVPIVSYLILGGKCRYCKTKLSIQYPLVEFVNGLGYALILISNGVNIKSEKLPLKMALVIGNEGNGISETVKSRCNKFVYIDMNDKCESLNASVAASILMYEVNGR